MRLPPKLLVLLTLTSALPITASRIASFNLTDLTQRADQIFLGRCTAATPAIVKGRDGAVEIPAVRYTFTVERAVAGASGETVEIMHLGSFTDGRHFLLDPDKVGVPRYTVGETYLLFVGRTSHNGLCSATGLRQGVFDVVGGRAKNRAGNNYILTGLDEVLAREPYRQLARAKQQGDRTGLPVETLLDLVRDLRAEKVTAPTMREVMQ